MSILTEKKDLINLIECAQSIAVIGHIRPDGDDLGSCLGLYNYIKDNYPEVKKLRVFLEKADAKFDFLSRMDEVSHKMSADDRDYDLVVCLDCASRERLGEYEPILDSAKHSICIDHHKTNPGYCEYNVIRGETSSTSEVLYEHLENDRISKDAAKCLYTGIVHDTGVFQYSSTTKRTMEVAGELLDKGLNPEEIISGSYYRKGYEQLRAWGYAYEKSVRCCGGKCIYTIMTWKDMKKFGVTSMELDGISSELKHVNGILFSALIYQDDVDTYKLSLRSTGNVDCSIVAMKHEGGGHAHASGCTCTGDPEKIAEMIMSEIEEQL